MQTVATYQASWDEILPLFWYSWLAFYPKQLKLDFRQRHFRTGNNDTFSCTRAIHFKNSADNHPQNVLALAYALKRLDDLGECMEISILFQEVMRYLCVGLKPYLNVTDNATDRCQFLCTSTTQFCSVDFTIKQSTHHSTAPSKPFFLSQRNLKTEVKKKWYQNQVFANKISHAFINCQKTSQITYDKRYKDVFGLWYIANLIYPTLQDIVEMPVLWKNNFCSRDSCTTCVAEVSIHRCISFGRILLPWSCSRRLNVRIAFFPMGLSLLFTWSFTWLLFFKTSLSNSLIWHKFRVLATNKTALQLHSLHWLFRSLRQNLGKRRNCPFLIYSELNLASHDLYHRHFLHRPFYGLYCPRFSPCRNWWFFSWVPWWNLLSVEAIPDF